MRAMVLESPGAPLRLKEIPAPAPGPDQVLIEVEACGVCRTDLHILDGDLPRPKLPLIPGHEVVGKIVRHGQNVTGAASGERIGVPWLGRTDGTCRYCSTGRENLCDAALFTGYTLDGGYAEYALADLRYCLPIPESYSAVDAAPLLCAGLIGYRSYRMAGQAAQHLGLYGFGAAAHLLIQVAVHEGKRVYAFTKPGDAAGQSFARRLGAVWAGSSEEMPPVKLDAAIVFAPVGALIPAALRATAKGGAVVCGGIHMSSIPEFPYALLWEERSVCSVANLTRQDGIDYFRVAPTVPVKAEVEVFALEQANEALARLREGTLKGAAVLRISGKC